MSSPPPDAPDDSGRVFREPWEAQAFAMTLSLHQQGLFTWSEWTSALAAQLSAAQATGEPGRADRYYHHWLAALEALVAAKGAASPQELNTYQRAWQHAVARTPHGQPWALEPSDF